MKNRTQLIVAIVASLVLTGGAATAQDTGWQVDPNHSQVGFTVSHLGITEVDGQFHDFEVDLDFERDDLADSSVDATIQAASIDTGIDRRDNHLRSPDFFDVEEHPTLEFHSTAVTDVTDEGFTLHGDLTIHGVTKRVQLDVEKSPVVIDPAGDRRVAFTATTEINREEFGLDWNRALEAGGFLVGKKVEIQLDIEAVKPAEAGADTSS